MKNPFFILVTLVLGFYCAAPVYAQEPPPLAPHGARIGSGNNVFLPILVKSVDNQSNSSLDYVTLPDDFPNITVSVPANDTGDGYIFLTNYHAMGNPLTNQPYLLILDNAGEPVYFKRTTPHTIAVDFKKQPNGLLTYFDRGTMRFHALDSSYTEVRTYLAGNGHQTDLHDLQILPNGHALLLAWDGLTMDMSEYVSGGNPKAWVIALVVQELDTAGNIVFEWRSWDHFEFTDTTADLTGEVVNYVHGNAVELDFDGNILISSRNMDEVTKINRQTGEIIWRLGGKRNEFTFINDDERFHRQHDIRRLPNGNITLLDNREGYSPRYSRAVEYQLDEVNKTATLVWEYRNTPDTYGPYLANAQRLPNGNTVIGWGSTVPTLTEVKPDGTKAFELTFDWPMVSYRAFRFPWQATPTWPPTLVAEAENSTTILYYSWNGATDIASYRIYAGNTPNPTTFVGVEAKTGFETRTDITDIVDEFRYFRVMPIDRNGNETLYSNVVSIPESSATETPLTRTGGGAAYQLLRAMLRF